MKGRGGGEGGRSGEGGGGALVPMNSSSKELRPAKTGKTDMQPSPEQYNNYTDFKVAGRAPVESSLRTSQLAL